MAQLGEHNHGDHLAPVIAEIQAKVENIKPKIDEICRISGCPGLSIGVRHKDRLVYRENIGHRDVENAISPDSDTIYNINSMTKFLTAAAIGILVEEGRLDWDTAVQSILPDFGKGEGMTGSMITVTDLLCHRSGHVSPDTYFLQDGNVLLLGKGQEISTFNCSNQKGGFRDSFLYNNFGYGVVGLLIETLSGQKYGTFLRSKIFEPLGLKRTTTDSVSSDGDDRFSEYDDNVSKHYSVMDDGTPYEIPDPKLGTSTLLEGAGGLKSTINDLLLLYQSFLTACDDQLRKGTTSSQGSPFKQCPTIIRAHNFLDEKATLRENSYALGWVRCQLPGTLGKMGINGRLQMDFPVVGRKSPSRLCLYHEGLMPGSTTNTYLFPETETIIVVLSGAVALNDCPNWISQLLIETIFHVLEENNFVELAKASADKMLTLMPSINLKLDSRRVPNTKSALSLDAYVGRYWNPIKNFFVEVRVNEETLHFSFQGLSSQSHILRHYHYDTFTWQMSHNQAVTRARLTVNYPAEFYLFKFNITWDGSVDRLYWRIENTSPETETFMKQ